MWVLLGSLGLLIAGLRTLAVLVMGREDGGWEVTETWTQRLFLLTGLVGLVLLGLVPQWFLPLLARLPLAFEQLVP
jgi:hypothetical protein